MTTSQTHDAVAPPAPQAPQAISPYAVSRGFAPPPPPPPISGSPAPTATLPSRPARPRSPLTRLVLSLAIVAFGAVIIVDMAGAKVPASVYFAVPLAVVGGGLVLGAWYGRGRGLIAVGAVLGVLLAITAGV